MAASLVSSVVAAGSVTSSSAPVVAAARSSASCTALLSPYGASFKTGVAVPAVARSAGYRTGTVSPPVLVGEFRALYVSRGVIRRRVVFALSILKVAFERAEELSAWESILRGASTTSRWGLTRPKYSGFWCSWSSWAKCFSFVAVQGGWSGLSDGCGVYFLFFFYF